MSKQSPFKPTLMPVAELPDTQTAVNYVVDYYRDTISKALKMLEKPSGYRKAIRYLEGVLNGTSIGDNSGS